MDVGLAAGARHHLRLDRERMQEIIDPLGRRVGIEPLAQLRILRGDADRAAAGMAVVAMAGLDADLALEIGLGNVLVAVERHQRRMADRDRVGAERQGLGHVAAVADAAGIDQRDLAALADLVDGAARLADGGDAGHAGILGGDMRAGAGAALHAVDIDGVGTASSPPCARRHRRARRRA